MGLSEDHCEACRAGAPQVTEDEVGTLMPEIPDWEIVEEASVRKLRRVYQFKDFITALAFTNQIGAVAEEQGHHPDLLTEWGKVTVTWWSHKIRGIHKNDFIMAARTDKIYSEQG